MNTLYLIAQTQCTRFAVPADRVQTVVGSMKIVPVPLAEPCVAGIAALRSRVIAILDMKALIAGESAGECSDRPIIVTEIGGHLYGLAVDRVHDIVGAADGPHPVETGLSQGWNRVSDGFIDTGDGAAITVHPDRLLTLRADAA